MSAHVLMNLLNEFQGANYVYVYTINTPQKSALILNNSSFLYFNIIF